MIEDTHLGEQGRLIRIKMLVGDLVVLKQDDPGQDELGSPARGPHTWKYPIHIDRAREAHHHLFDDPIIAEGLPREVISRSGGMFGRKWLA
jgi:hypothetical protein